MSLDRGTRLGPYEIVEPIGAGGMGEVYRARDARLNRCVAIKISGAQFSERFEREARAIAALNHPHICSLYDVGPDYLVMELVEGPTLAERMAAGRIPVEEALAIARQIAEALEAAHEKGIVHRDLKPANVKITPDGVVKVLDFGLAKSAEESTAASADASRSPTLTISPTRAGMILGTAAYMSPEQIRGTAVDKRSDIWAFGVVLYEMLAGRRLFTGESVSDILAAALKSDPDWSALPAGTPPRIRKLLQRCLERDRKQRLQAIGEARIVIDAPEEHFAPPRSRGIPYGWVAATALLAFALATLSALHFRERPQESALVRFQIPMAEPLSSSMRARRAIALSPDGRHIAFVAPGPAGQLMLWVRALDSLEAHLLPGTESASHPFWSPDGRQLAFFTAVTLKKIDLSGGAAQTICSVSSIHGGTWNRDGVILVQGGSGGGIGRVSPTGGEFVPVTTPDSNRGELWHGYPQFLPDGQHFLYFVFTGTEARSGIYLGSLDGKEKKSLLGTNFSAAYAGPSPGEKKGRLLFLREGLILAQPVDPVTLESSGEAVTVASGVASVAHESLFTVSAGGVLAYRSDSLAFPKAPLTWFDRTGKVLGELGPRGYYTNLAISPDGSRVAVGQVDEQSGNTDIWILDAASGTPSRFTFDHGTDRAPVWSPDGRRIIFQSDRDGQYKLYTNDAAKAGNDHVLLQAVGSPEATDWSSDGRFLLLWTHSASNGYDLWVLPDMTGDGAERKPVPYLRTPFDETQGQFRPEAAGGPLWVAYTSNATGSYEVYVQSFPAGSGKAQISSGGGTQPRWRRDGKELFYIAAGGKLMSVTVNTTPAFAHSAPSTLFDPHQDSGGIPQFPFRYDVSPDGKRFLVVSSPQVNDAANERQPSAITVVVNWMAPAKP